ncbi:MAG: neutral zinc metallopeptidase [Micropruina sp.]|uniref:neutral zinc metallopeptidase n=1 Tax=Micropruina sp. TaxID=2737536 RepID=UPI0039E36678
MTQGLPYRNAPDPAHLVPRTFGSPGRFAAFGVQPPAPPPHHPLGPGKFLVVVLVVVGLVVAGLQTLPTLATAPFEPAPTSTESTAATSPRARPGDPLTDSKLYPLALNGSCPAVQKVTTRDAYEKQVSELLGCLEGLFRPLIEQADGDFAPAQHRFYGRSTSSPCGTQQEAYAFYCTKDATLYFSDEVFEDAKYARLMVADVVIHEYGHHVQAMMGMFDAADRLGEDNAVTTRREELQVFCWTYYVFATLPSFALTAEDQSYFRQVWDNTDDPDGHGSVKAQQYWGARGLAARNLGACNTWAVSANRVR